MTGIERTACLEPCPAEGGNLVGRDPRHMGKTALQAAGFRPMTPMEVIRAKCLDCCASSAQEVRYCVAVDCPSWPYRMGSNPFRPPVSEERKAKLRANTLKARVALTKPIGEPYPDTVDDSWLPADDPKPVAAAKSALA
jgi:hypothetical protein